MRGDSEAEASVHAPVALGSSAFIGAAQLLNLLLSAVPEHTGRDREVGKPALLSGLPLALLVLDRVRVVADNLVPALHEEGKLS